MPKGRKPKPTRLKLMDGNRGHKAGLKAQAAAEPSAGGAFPPCPPHLDAKAKAVWRRLCGLLASMGAGKVDGLALERLCAIYARIRDCEKVVAREGLTYESETQNGSIVRPRPEVGIMAVAERELRALLVEFGLTPSSRTRLKVSADTKEDDELEAFMAGGSKKAK